MPTFSDYVRACKLYEFHAEGRSRLPRPLQNMCAMKNLEKKSIIEQAFPEFIVLYQRYKEDHS